MRGSESFGLSPLHLPGAPDWAAAQACLTWAASFSNVNSQKANALRNVDGKDANSTEQPPLWCHLLSPPSTIIQPCHLHLLKALWPFPRPPPHPGPAGRGQKPSLGSLGLCLIHSPHCSWRGIFTPHIMSQAHTQGHTLSLKTPSQNQAQIPSSGRRTGLHQPLHLHPIPTSSPPRVSWWLRQLRICLQCRRPGFDPWVRKDPLEKGMATYSTILASRIQWTEKPGRPQTMSHKASDTVERLTL